MSPGVQAASQEIIGFPRVSGDEPWQLGPIAGAIKFSPRERG